MNDWIEIDEAYLYCTGAKEPYKGSVIHSKNGSNSRGWFVKEDRDFMEGIDVPDEEGKAQSDCVWFRRRVSMETVLDAFRECYEAHIRDARGDINYYTGLMKELGIKTEDEG